MKAPSSRRHATRRQLYPDLENPALPPKKRTRIPKYVYVMRNGHFVKMRVTKIVTFVLEEVKE